MKSMKKLAEPLRSKKTLTITAMLELKFVTFGHRVEFWTGVEVS